VSNEKSETRIQRKELTRFIDSIFLKAGVSRVHAGILAQKIVDTNLYGVDSHGVLRVPVYTRRIIKGVMNNLPKFRLLKDQGFLGILDGDNAPGILAANAGMHCAIKKAKKSGLGICGVVKSNHFGAAGVFARLASDNNLVGIALTNVAPLMSMPGAKGPIIGNNPFAIAVPAREFPLVLDISLSQVALGKILMAQKKGEAIPSDWAVDLDGNPTTDPVKAAEGYLLPLGAHKGFGLALMVDLFCGLLTGGAFLQDLKGMYKFPNDPSLTAHLFIAYDPGMILTESEYQERIDLFVKTIKNTPTAPGVPQVILPGEIEFRSWKERIEKGIPLQETLIVELNSLASELGVKDRL